MFCRFRSHVVLALLAVAGFFGFLPGSALAQALPTPCRTGMVLVADGAGDSASTSESIGQVVRELGLPLEVYRWPWSHGRFRAVADQTDEANLRANGRNMAAYLAAYRQQNPDKPIYLVGHSAGALVILTAVECAPPGTVDRAFLFAPSMASSYDVRPALRNVKCNIHNYYSRHDWLVLGVATRLIGTADGQWTTAAGRVGFRSCIFSMEDSYLYSKMFQRPWTSADRALGNQGNHYGDYQPAFLRAHVLPWMQTW